MFLYARVPSRKTHTISFCECRCLSDFYFVEFFEEEVSGVEIEEWR